MDWFEQSAWNMLTDPYAQRAFDLSQEDVRTRDRYGRTRWGQQCLLARRLVEHGVDLVTTTLAGPEAGPVQNWDDHAVNHHVFDIMKKRAANFDRAVTALIEDIYDRGLDKRVMVLVTGEFGRTPKISYATGSISKVRQPGRDHWPRATSMLFAGGGITPGQVIGATDIRGEDVVARRIGPVDFLPDAANNLPHKARDRHLHRHRVHDLGLYPSQCDRQLLQRFSNGRPGGLLGGRGRGAASG